MRDHSYEQYGVGFGAREHAPVETEVVLDGWRTHLQSVELENKVNEESKLLADSLELSMYTNLSVQRKGAEAVINEHLLFLQSRHWIPRTQVSEDERNCLA
jgi:hypothetical protein